MAEIEAETRKIEKSAQVRQTIMMQNADVLSNFNQIWPDQKSAVIGQKSTSVWQPLNSFKEINWCLKIKQQRTNHKLNL